MFVAIYLIRGNSLLIVWIVSKSLLKIKKDGIRNGKFS